MKLEIILISVILIIVILIAVLYVIERRMLKTMGQKKHNRNETYLNKLKKAIKKSPRVAIEEINKIARDFFSEKFMINKSIEYGEIKEKNKVYEITEFSNLMESLRYSKNVPSTKDIASLNSLLTKIIQENPILPKEEKTDSKENKKVLGKKKKH